VRSVVRQVGKVAVVDLAGKLVLGEGDVQLREQVLGLLDSDRRQILLNLRDVSYMDSAGLGELGALHRRARARSGDIKLLAPSPKVGNLLRLSRLDEIFDTFEDEQEAIASF
jgi:anti-sigma B factor antagonist